MAGHKLIPTYTHTDMLLDAQTYSKCWKQLVWREKERVGQIIDALRRENDDTALRDYLDWLHSRADIVQFKTFFERFR